ncbi:MAG: M1 family aminopeptidase [bacterium]|nr:M1 family aminopeptidase [bacterium]
MQKITIFLRSVFCLLAIGQPLSHYSQQINCQNSKPSPAASIYYSAENLRSDTFDILKYTINLEIGSTTASQIKGNTQVRFAPKMNNRNFIRFDLLKLIIDSIKEGNTILTYTYNDTIVKINFTAPKNVTDTSVFTVFYKGQPQIDASNWGGFYFDNTQNAQYAYNLGVGFAAKPHNYGRVWFPCFDNFVERSTYEFNITTDTLRRAHCNGQLISDVISNQKRTRKWILTETIPTYLACVAVAKYVQVNWTVATLNGIKPITLVGVAADTAAMKTGFVNLKNCITGFENYYGPYKWNKFGYSLVPFNSGAMEHATNITYPRSAIGNLANEDLYVHELSHHWWGDLITCETQEDMWINEGMASFSAFLFFEWQYGKANYLAKVKTQHDDLLHFLHKKEGGFRAISGVPHSLTYGDHVYKKGADVAHTLRGYMGDTAFFNAIKYTMQQKAYKSINSTELMNLMQTSSTQNLNDFFNGWVFSGGWPHFSIDSVRYVSVGSNSVNAIVSLKQKLFGAPAIFSNVPLEISFFKGDWSRVTKKVVMSGTSQTFTVPIPFSAVLASLNYDSKINDATSHEYKTIKTPGSINYALGKVLLQVVNSGADSSLIRVIHNYVKSDPFKTTSPHKLSDQHFWKVEGIFSPGFVSKAQFNYNGYKGTTGAYIYMDTLLTRVNGDSIALFYRSSVLQDWQWLKSATVTAINPKSGYITIDTLKPGEYTFGNLGDKESVGLRITAGATQAVKIFPNPARQKCTIECSMKAETDYLLRIYNMDGKIVLSGQLKNKSTVIDVSELIPGSYVITIWKEEGSLLHSQKLIIE